MRPRHAAGFAALVAVTVWLMTAPAAAHHSFAMFDEEHAIKITGTVVKFSWANPHVVFWVAVVDKDNKATIYTIESPYGPGNLPRWGWDKYTLKVGDKLDLWISPLKDGKPGGSLEQLTFLATGKVMYNGSRGSHGGLNTPEGAGLPAGRSAVPSGTPNR